MPRTAQGGGFVGNAHDLPIRERKPIIFRALCFAAQIEQDRRSPPFTRRGHHAALCRQSRLPVHRAAADRALRRGRGGRLQGGRAAGRPTITPRGAEGRNRQARPDAAWHQHLRRRPAGDSGLGAVPGRERDWDVVFKQALDYTVAIGGSAIHCMAGVVPPEQRPAAERTFIANLARAADLARDKNVTCLIEPINHARPAELFPDPHRAGRRHHRQGRQAERENPVRFLSCADRQRRPHHAASKSICR